MGKAAKLERPARVTLAIRLLFVVIVLGIIQAAIVALRHIDVRTPDVLIVTKLVIYSLSLLLLYQLGRGDNWARWSLVPILALTMPLAILPVMQSFANYPLYGLLELAQVGLFVVALALLFQKTATQWFVRSV